MWALLGVSVCAAQGSDSVVWNAPVIHRVPAKPPLSLVSRVSLFLSAPGDWGGIELHRRDDGRVPPGGPLEAAGLLSLVAAMGLGNGIAGPFFFELGAELTYPAPEGTSAGLLCVSASHGETAPLQKFKSRTAGGSRTPGGAGTWGPHLRLEPQVVPGPPCRPVPFRRLGPRGGQGPPLFPAPYLRLGPAPRGVREPPAVLLLNFWRSAVSPCDALTQAPRPHPQRHGLCCVFPWASNWVVFEKPQEVSFFELHESQTPESPSRTELPHSHKQLQSDPKLTSCGKKLTRS